MSSSPNDRQEFYSCSMCPQSLLTSFYTLGPKGIRGPYPVQTRPILLLGGIKPVCATCVANHELPRGLIADELRHDRRHHLEFQRWRYQTGRMGEGRAEVAGEGMDVHWVENYNLNQFNRALEGIREAANALFAEGDAEGEDE